jgi:hypothetical protein
MERAEKVLLIVPRYLFLQPFGPHCRTAAD